MLTKNYGKEIMTKNLITIEASDSMVSAWKKMNDHHIRHLPVLDERKMVVGILSDRDVQRAMQVTRKNQFEQEIRLDANYVVEDFMSWPVYVVHESTSVRKIAEEMLAQKVSAFIVEDSTGRLKGIITTDDLIKLFLTEPMAVSDTALKGLVNYFAAPETA